MAFLRPVHRRRGAKPEVLGLEKWNAIDFRIARDGGILIHIVTAAACAGNSYRYQYKGTKASKLRMGGKSRFGSSLSV
jgi:hypothetical protein